MPGLERRRPSLVSIHGAHLGKRWTVEACGVVIGRDPAQAELALPDPAVSGRHCALELEPATGEFTVSDLASRNGTFVNSEKVAERRLPDGDRIFVGETVLEFTLEELESSDDDKTQKAGSLSIAEVGRIIREGVASAGCACRNSSCEFPAFLHPLELSRGLELAELIRARVAAYEFERDGVQVHPTISIGIAQLHPGLPTPDHLLQAADEALYRAKRTGRNQVSR
jgi:diguanylate cyclase (GGDEF)-like protein